MSNGSDSQILKMVQPDVENATIEILIFHARVPLPLVLLPHLRFPLLLCLVLPVRGRKTYQVPSGLMKCWFVTPGFLALSTFPPFFFLAGGSGES